VREQGGVYFVPREHAAFVDKVQALLSRVNGRLARFPVPEGTREGDRSVKEAVANGIAALIAEHREAVAGFDTDTRSSTLQRAAERIRVVRHKLSAYAAYLADERERLEKDLSAAARDLYAKVERLGSNAETTS
jgi:hypothetical protein